MSQNQDIQSIEQVRTYFGQYDNLIKSHQDMQEVDGIGNKIQKQLNNGNMKIEDKKRISEASINKLSQQIQNKKNQFNKDLILLKMSLNRSSYMLSRKKSNQSDRAPVKMRGRSQTQISIDDLQEYEKKKLSWSRRLKQLKNIKSQITRKRQVQQMKKSRLLKRQDQRKRQERQKLCEELKNQKISRIKQRMKKLQQSRIQRVDKLKNSYTKSSQELPRFKKMRYQFDRKQIEYQLTQKQKIMLQKRQKNQQSSLHSIKLHKQEYQRKHSIKTRRKQPSPQQLARRQAEYNRLHNPQRQIKIKQSKSRIKNYDEKIGVIRDHMKLDPKIGKQIQIAKDRTKHPFKYHYLKTRKHLSDEEIFDNYSQFNFNSDPIQLGNSYLQQINMQNSQIVKKLEQKSGRRVKTDVTSSSQKKIYKDYLQQSKQNSRKHETDQIEQLMRQHGEKSKVIQILQSRAAQQVAKSMKKIQKLKQIGSYTNALTIQKQIDQQFINSIKTKLKCFQVK